MGWSLPLLLLERDLIITDDVQFLESVAHRYVFESEVLQHERTRNIYNVILHCVPMSKDEKEKFKEKVLLKEKELLKEYEMLRQLMEKHDTQITQIRAIFLGFLGLYFGWIFKDVGCFNEFESSHCTLLMIPVFIALFFFINEGFIQYWKHKAVCRFKYLECMMENYLKPTREDQSPEKNSEQEKCVTDGAKVTCILEIDGPHMRLEKKGGNHSPNPHYKESYYVESGRMGLIKELISTLCIPYFSVFYLPIIFILFAIASYCYCGKDSPIIFILSKIASYCNCGWVLPIIIVLLVICLICLCKKISQK